ncbi:MAG: hypothetical protein FH756_20650 [Firmicutes bacterium]|nr:hypothetical protein [Bacillota bacterium]
MLKIKKFMVTLMSLMILYLLAGHIYIVLESEFFLTTHLTLEVASVIVAILVSIFCWYGYRYQQQQKMLILAFTFCIMGMLDFVHSLSYLGMPDFITDNSANKASTYWILARLVQGLGIFLAIYMKDRKLRIPAATIVFILVILVSMAGIGAVAFLLPYLPGMYDPTAQTQTMTKIFSEYIVIGLYVLTAGKLLTGKSTDKRDIFLTYALAVGVFGELAFATYNYVYDSYNLLGHIFKITSFGLILKGLFDEAIGQLYQTNDELDGQRRALEKANAQLQKTDQMKDEFLANTNHELRSPLTAIIAFTELLQDPQTGPLTPLQRDYVNEISDSSNDLLSRVAEIRDLSRIKAGKMILRSEKIMVEELVENIVRRFKPQYDNKGVFLEVQYPESIIVTGDVERVSQILSNLLSNSLKFTPAGGTVLVSAYLDNILNHAKITVEDNGIGIDPLEHEAIFDMFYQVDGTSSRSYGGTGLGLSLVKSLVELQGGTINLASRPNQGSIFSFSLPLYGKTGYTEVDYGT